MPRGRMVIYIKYMELFFITICLITTHLHLIARHVDVDDELTHNLDKRLGLDKEDEEEKAARAAVLARAANPEAPNGSRFEPLRDPSADPCAHLCAPQDGWKTVLCQDCLFRGE